LAPSFYEMLFEIICGRYLPQMLKSYQA